nr:alkene reductase [uncultured Cupriavidus sp.]
MSNILFSPLELGQIQLGHRVVMAPLTRLRADQNGDIPNALMRDYYAQRASPGGLIISEATTVSATGRGYLGAPGLYTDAQGHAWQEIVTAVHARGARIVAQLWHVGRTAHASLLGGAVPVTASVVPYEGVAFTSEGWVPVSPARALETTEIAALIAEYVGAARRALQAGFDGVEIHAANGYLIDQFLQDGSNRRTDQYGGPIENRARLLIEIVDAVRAVWGDGRVGVRLTPSSHFNGMSNSDPEADFRYIARALAGKGLAYLHVVEPRVVGSEDVAEDLRSVAARDLRAHFDGPVIAAGGFDGDEAQSEIAHGHVDAVAFGRSFIANPDLPSRIRDGQPLNPYDRNTFYGGDSRGYTDYPAWQGV